MMLHRHFESQRARREENMTKVADVTPTKRVNTDNDESVPAPVKRVGRPKKTTKP